MVNPSGPIKIRLFYFEKNGVNFHRLRFKFKQDSLKTWRKPGAISFLVATLTKNPIS